MMIYAARLELTDDDAHAQVVDGIESWLKTSKRLSDIFPLNEQPSRIELKHGAFIETAQHGEADSASYAFRYAHPDRMIRGREWLTEVGFHKHSDSSTCTVLLHTREASAQVQSDIETTRPRVVPEIVNRCTLASQTPGGRLQRLTESDSEAFEWMIGNPERKHAIVQVSPREVGGYCVDPKRLSDLLVGIADVVVIPEGTDTFALSDVLGPRFSAYHGAVNVLWTMVRKASGSFVPSTRLLATELESILAQGKRPESDLLAMIGHRSNAAIARSHLSPERVQTISLRSELEHAAREKTTEDSELEALYKKVDKEQADEIKQLSVDLADEEARRSDAESKARELEGDVASLKAQLIRASSGTPSTNQGLTHEDMAFVVRAISDGAELVDCLEAVERLYRGRVVVLESARASARKASAFKNPRKAFALLSTLCSDYYDALSSGQGDNAGKDFFGKNAFTAKESETVESNKKAAKLRTFKYKGKDTPMMPHLKIGVKDSAAETFRCHFVWDVEAKVIVIGHCGKHLDFK